MVSVDQTVTNFKYLFTGALEVLLGLSLCLDLWGAMEPTFAPVLAWVCLALPAMKRLDSKVTIGNQTWYTF